MILRNSITIKPFQDGCLTKANDLVAQALTILIIAIVVIILFQVICMILACCSKGGKQVDVCFCVNDTINDFVRVF